ncbi:MAG: DUF2288 family protein [Bacteriovoracaceae bacterium]
MEDERLTSLKDSLKVLKKENFSEHVEQEATILLSHEIDLLSFAVNCIDDNFLEIKQQSEQKQVLHFNKDLFNEASDEMLFSTLLIQPYLIIQDKVKRDLYLKEQDSSQDSESEEVSSQEGESTPDEENS